MARRKKPTDQAAETTLTAPPSPPSPAAVLQAVTWIVEGRKAADILAAIAEHFPQESPETLLSAALEDLTIEGAKTDPDRARGFLLYAYRELYRRALEVDDFKNAISALRSFERVTGC
jgi:hypothetical protein